MTSKIQHLFKIVHVPTMMADKMTVTANQGKIEQDWLIQRTLQPNQNISIGFWLNFCYFLLMLNQKGKFRKMEW